MMKKGFVVGVLLGLVGVCFGLGCGQAGAADIEIIMGPSSGFNVVRGTSAAAGTSILYVGSSTASVGTTTQHAAMLYVVGSSTSSADAALKVGTATVWVGNGGAVGVGTTTPSTALQVVGTVTATAVNAASYTGGGAYTHYVGELYGGGVVYYVYKTAGVEHGLICSTADQGTSQAWSNVTGTAIGATAQSRSDGLSNSNAIVAQSGHTSSAAKLCLDYTNTDTGTGVYSDWYLPSWRELSLMSQQAFAIEKALSSVFAGANYWSSTEDGYNDGNAFTQDFVAGGQSSYGKGGTYYVRAVRAF